DDERLEPPHRQDERRRRLALRGDPLRVRALDARAVQRIAGEGNHEELQPMSSAQAKRDGPKSDPRGGRPRFCQTMIKPLCTVSRPPLHIDLESGSRLTRSGFVTAASFPT